MALHKKHEDSLDVQVRTRILDEYGNEMLGVIEYDPVSGFGKRIKLDARPDSGFVEPFFRKGGSIEIDGHAFTAENQDENEIAAITTLIDAKVARGTPEYEQLLKHHIDTNRQNEKDKQKDKNKLLSAVSLDTVTTPTLDQVDASIPFVAKTQIARGEEVILDLHNREVTGVRSDNIHRPKGPVSADKKSFE